MRAYLAIGRPLLVLEPIAAVLVLASGVYLAGVGTSWNLAWVQVAAAMWVMNAAVAGAIVKPAIGRLAAAAASTAGAVGAHLNALRRARRWTMGGNLLMANGAAALYLMMKPEMIGSLLTVALANLIVMTAAAVGFRRTTRSPAYHAAGV